MKMISLSRSIYLHGGHQVQKGDYNSNSFARGFDDFAVTWPPSTGTVNINDDK
jgi:hypothetical protein